MSSGNLTRIQNNQIYDSTIVARSKVQAGSITGNLLAPTVTFNSNITILGNLQVANSYTQLNSVNTYINDPIVVFNNGYVGDISGYDIGILVNRNTTSLPGYAGGVNTFFGWAESEQAFIAIATTETGTTVSSINNSGYANVHIGNLSVAGVNAGTFSATAILNTPISGGTGSFTYLTATTGLSTSNARITGGDINSLTTLSATTATATNFSSANIQATSISAEYITATTGLSTSNAKITGGTVDGTVIGGTTASTGTFTTLLATTGLSTANALITGGDVNGLTTLAAGKAVITNFSTGNARITGGDINSLTTLSATTATFTNFSSGNITGTFNGFISAANVAYFIVEKDATDNNTYYPIFGNVAGGNSAPFTNAGLTYNPSTGQFSATKFSATTVSATNASIGTITATTGLSTGNALISGGDVNSLTTLSAATATATNFSSANIIVTNASATRLETTNFSTGNALISGGDVNGLTTLAAGKAVVANFSTGNARIAGGYADNFAIGANTKATGAFTTLSVSANISLATGANIIPTVDGANDLGSPTNRFKSLWLTDATLYVGGAAISTDTNGNIKLTTESGALLSVGNLNYESTFTGNVRAQWFRGNLEGLNVNGTTGTIGTFTTTTGYATDLSSGNIIATNASATRLQSTNFSTGNARIAGGYADNFAIGANTKATGAFTTLTASDAVTFTSAASSYSTGTGALIVTGGVGIGGNLNVSGRADIGGNVYITGNLQVTGQSVNIGASSLVIKDPVINLHTLDDFSAWGSNDLADIGLLMHYYDTVDSLAFAGRVNSSGFFEYYAKGTEVANVFTGTTRGTIKGGDLKAANTTPSTSTTTGALTVAGGAGIAGDLYAANLSVGTGNVTVGNLNATSLYGTFYGVNSGTTDYALKSNISLHQDLANSTTNASFYIPFYDKATGNAKTYTNTTFYTNPSSGNLYAGTFSGAATGLTGTAWQLTAGFADYATDAGYASTSGSSSQSDAVAVTATGASAPYYLTFVSSAATDYYGLGSDANLSYNPSTNTLTSEIISYGGADGTYLKATNFSTGNAAISGGDAHFGTLHSTNFSTGNAVITGGNSRFDNLYATNFSSGNAAISGGDAHFGTLHATNLSTGNLSISGGDASFGTLRATNFSTGNAVVTGGTVSVNVLQANNFSTANAAISGGDASFGTLRATNFSTGNAAISGGDASFGTLRATNFSTGNAVVTGGTINNTAIGATTASTGKFTTIVASSNIVAASGTASTNTTTGALVVAGGAGMSGALNVGGQVTLTGAGTAADAGGQLYLNGATSNRIDWAAVGTGAPAFTTRSAGTKLVLYPSLTGSTSDYAMGVDAATMWTSVPENTSGFNFKWYGATTQVASLSGTGVFTAAGNIVAESTTNSTSSTTGALVVKGGLGVVGNVFLGNAVTINSSQTANQDFYVKGVNDTTLVWARPNTTYDQLVVGGSATAATLVRGAKLIVNSTDSMLLPTGSSAQRPGAAGGTDTIGMLRYSTTRGTMEFYDGAAWQSATATFTVIVEQQFTGTGSQTAFTLNQAATTASVIVSINGVIQIGGSGYAYTVSGTTLTFSEAPSGTDIIDVRILTTTQTIRGVASDNSYNGIHTDNNSVYLTTGTGSAVTIRSWLPNGAEVNSTTPVTALTTTTIDTFDATLYTSAEYVVTVTDGSGLRTISKFLVAAGSASGAYLSAITTIDSAGGTSAPGTYSVTNATGSIALKFTPTSGSYSVRVKATYQAV